MAGKARRFNSYDVDVRNERRIAESFGLARQSQSGYTSSFRASPISPVTTQRNPDIDSASGEDNLGNHIATQTLNMDDNDISGIDNMFSNTVGTNDASIQGHANGILYIATLTNTRANQYHMFYTGGTEAGDVRLKIEDDVITVYEHVLPEPDSIQNLGSSIRRFKNIYLNGDINNLGTLTVGGTSVFSSTVTLVNSNLVVGAFQVFGTGVDEDKIEPSTGYVGYCTGSNSTTLGDYGTMQLPYLSNGTQNPSDLTLDGWFGDTNGCIGIQYYSGTGSNHRLWVKSDGDWVKNFLT